MKGKSQFTQAEIEQISDLIQQKLNAGTEEQKTIRSKIRALGFYASDFGVGKGYTVEDFLRVINKSSNLNEIHADLIRRYKDVLKDKKLKGEIYKWKLLGEFVGRPDLDALNLLEELKSTKFQNLAYPMAIAVSYHIAAEAPEKYRECLRKLFDESVPLQSRLDDFNSNTLSVYREVGGRLSHHHDERMMATFLTFHNPTKYAFYKDSFYRKYCKLTGIQRKKKGLKYVHYMELLSNFKTEFVDTDQELLNMVQPLIPTNAFQDPNHLLLAQDILYTVLDNQEEEIELDGASVFKVSMGSLSDQELKECLDQSIIIVHKETRGKGTSTESQAESFEHSIQLGDYFYMTHGNGPGRMKVLGRVTGEAESTSKSYVGEMNWWQRKFELVATSVNQSAYKGPNKWWTPNNNSTFIQIKPGELEEANKLIFEPYFNTTFISSDSTVVKEPITDYPKPSMSMPLNQILFGPPGTGKTYRLLTEYFPRFTSKPKQVSQDQYKIDLVSNNTWWQVVSAIVLDLKSTHVSGILDHPMLRAKDSVSNQANARAMIWAMLQQHTKADCEYVKYSKRNEPLFFNKDKDGNWTIDEKIADSEAPEVRQLLNAWNKPTIPDEAGEIKRYSFVTFHQSFSYEDFVEGIKPILSEGSDESNIEYEIKPGIFKELCARARRDPENEYALFIDEINRGNVSQIFGELITLIEDDKREGSIPPVEVELPYSKSKFSVPPNLYIIGTMNTADRSVEALDTALRRRFSFIEMRPRYNLPELQKEVAGVMLKELLEKINQRIEKLLDKDHLIGHSYFLKVSSITGLKEVLHHKINPLLQEYFFGDIGKIGLVLGSDFFEQGGAHSEEESDLFADFNEYDSSELSRRAVYHLRNVTEMSDSDFVKAIAKLMKR